MRNKNKNSYHPDARKFDDLSPVFKDDYDWSQDHPAARHFKDTSPIFRDESRDNPSLLDDQPEDSYALKLKSIPKIFHDNQVINDNTHRLEVSNASGIKKVDSYANQLKDVPQIFHDQDIQDSKPAPTLPLAPSENRPAAREIIDTSPIFLDTPPTETEFWGEEKAPRAIKLAQSIGRLATRTPRQARAAGYDLVATGAAKARIGVTHAKEAAWREADRLASSDAIYSMFVKYSLGERALFGVVAYANDNINNARNDRDGLWEDFREFQNKATQIRSAAPSPNLDWKNKYFNLAQENLKAAQDAYSRGDTSSARRHMESARRNQRIHGRNTPYMK